MYYTLITIVLSSIFWTTGSAQIILPYKSADDYPKSMVSYSDFEDLMREVKNIRADKLISFEQLKAFQVDTNTVLLDARSKDRFASRHLKGAINLPYTDFTQANLRKIIPDPNTRVLIYCNNNFIGDEVDFASKRMVLTSRDIKNLEPRTINTFGIPKKEFKKLHRRHKKELKKMRRSKKEAPKQTMLALNVPTYITLYGYGYRNIYELDELVDVRSAREDFAGTKNGMQGVRFVVSPSKK